MLEFKKTIKSGETSIKDLSAAGLDWCRWALFLGWEEEFDFLGPVPLEIWGYDLLDEGPTDFGVVEQVEYQLYRDVLAEGPKKVWDMELQQKTSAAEHDPLGQFLVRATGLFVNHPFKRPGFLTRFSAYVRAYCERGRLSARRFLLTSESEVPCACTCFSLLFQFFASAAYVCLKHPFIVAVVNHVDPGDDGDTYTAWLLPKSCPDRVILSEIQRRVLRQIIDEVPLGKEVVNATSTWVGDREEIYCSTLLLLLLENDMEEETEVFLRRYGSVLTPRVLNRGNHEDRHGRNNTPLSLALKPR